ncbi:MAG: ATP-binding protein [Lachnospiraceae bacterium]|nr:ATP-binding protein [Lachnospiraceae bacterium]
MQISTILKYFDANEPMLLFIGGNFDYAKNNKLLDLPWSCIYESIQEDQMIIRKLNNDSRLCRKIYRPEDIKGKVLDQKNLKVVKLFEENADESSAATRRIVNKNASNLLDKIPQLIQYIGMIVIVGYAKDDKVNSDMMCTLLSELRNESIIYIGDCNAENQDELREILNEKKAIVEEKIEFLSIEDEIAVEYQETVDNSVGVNRIYISGKLYDFETSELFEISKFAEVLDYAKIHGQEIPAYLYQNYFYAFIKNSVYKPQWFGYKAGFNLERYFEAGLYKNVVKALDNPAKDNKPILIMGQTGSGKSIALANLAYKIFCEKQYPVIYMNNINLDFSPKVQKKEGKISHAYSAQFKALDTLIQKYETMGARNILLIWDGSAFIRDRDKYISLYNVLRNKRGHNIVLVCSAYESFESETDEADNRPFRIVNVNIKFQKDNEKDERDELSKFKTLLKRKAKLDKEEIDRITNLIVANEMDYNNIMTTFYYLFYDVRAGIEKGVQDEAEKMIGEVIASLKFEQKYVNVLKDAMIKAGAIVQKEFSDEHDTNTENVNLKDFLICVAICSQYKLAMPSRMAFEIMGVTEMEEMKKVLRIPFFSFEDEEDMDFSIRIRTKLEAELLLKAYKVTAEEEVNHIKNIIYSISENDYFNQGNEIDMVTTLLYRMGPNSGNLSINKKYQEYYLEISEALKEIREERQIITPSLGLQEITYMREYCLSAEVKDEKKIELLKKAIEIGDELLGIFSRYGNLITANDMLTVEISNSRLRLCALDKSLILKESERGLTDIKGVIAHNPDNIYAYHAMIELAILQYNEEEDDLVKAELLAELCDIVDRVKEENLLTASNRYFIEPADKVFQLCGEFKCDEYFDELIKQGNYAGIYLKAKKMLANAGLEQVNKEKYTDKQISDIKHVIEELLENPRYKEITSKSHQCQYLLLRLKWIVYNKKPVFSLNGKYTRMNIQEWNEIKQICEHYNETFIKSNLVEESSAVSVLYILALAYAELDDFKSSMRIVLKLRNDTEWFGYGNRTRVKHYLCDENGQLLTYSGSFTSDTDEITEKGYVQIDKIKPEWNNYKSGIYFHKHNIKDIEIKSGLTSNKFQLGLAYMGFSVFHGQNVKEV